tara:strand:- start:261 stop:401 length:141 start_codon:yes stop_codon:yes gene_type:complete
MILVFLGFLLKGEYESVISSAAGMLGFEHLSDYSLSKNSGVTHLVV